MRQPCSKCIFLSRSYCDRHYIRRAEGSYQVELQDGDEIVLCDFVRLVDKPEKENEK